MEAEVQFWKRITTSWFTFQVEKRLAVRLEAGVKAWIHCLQGQRDDPTDNSMDTDEPKQQAHKPGGDPHIKVGVHCIAVSVLGTFHLSQQFQQYMHRVNEQRTPGS